MFLYTLVLHKIDMFLFKKNSLKAFHSATRKPSNQLLLFFSAALLHINVLTFSRSLIFLYTLVLHKIDMFS